MYANDEIVALGAHHADGFNHVDHMLSVIGKARLTPYEL